MLSSAVLYGLLAMLGWGLQNTLMKGIVDKYGPLQGIILRNIPAVLILIVVIIGTSSFPSFTPASFFLGLFIAVLGYFPFMFFIFALKRGKAGIIYPTSSLRILAASLFGFLVLGELFTAGKTAVVVAVFLGVLLLTLNFKNLKESDIFSIESGVPLALLAALLWGVILPLFKFPSEALGALFFTLMVEGVILVAALIHLTLYERTAPKLGFIVRSFRGQELWLIIAAGVSTALGTMFVNLGYETGEISIVTAISSSSVLIAVVGAAFLYKERLTSIQYGGVAVVLLGIVTAAML